AGERVARPDKLGSQTGIVVNLAVEDRPDGAVFVGDRLMAALDIDDCEAPGAQRYTAFGIDEHAFVVRAAMYHRGVHRLSVDSRRIPCRSRNSTHKSGV